MIEIFPVWIGDRQIGNAQISKIGLFYEIFCKCKLPDMRIYRLHAQCAAGIRQLGILAPGDGAFTVLAKTSVEKMPLENIRFFAHPVDSSAHPQLIQVCPDMPFEKLDLLEEISCVMCDGEIFLALNGDHPD